MKTNLKKLVSKVLAVVMLAALLLPAPAFAKTTAGLNRTSATVYVGSSVTLTLNDASGTVTWSSSNRTVATVSSDGVVTGKKAGSATITAKNAGKSYRCRVTVKNPCLSKTRMNIKTGTDPAIRLNGDTVASVKSSAPDAAPVRQTGQITVRVTGAKPGKSTITVTGTSGRKYTCQVTVSDKGILVCIDPGHQRKGNSNTEPIGPGSSTRKAKVTSGTYGKTSKLYEYELVLKVSLKLRDELESRGYAVMMTRTKNDVNISNAERAKMANNAGADIFVRVHANGSTDTSTHGAMTICQTSKNPFNKRLHSKSRDLSSKVLNSLVKSTGCKKIKIWETDTMTGINWSKVPVTIVEMGYMTNPKEDSAMASSKYQKRIVNGIANGIDNYFD